jgi:hypothetical protein
MVSVSRETPEETDRRLRRVIAAATFETLAGVWRFEESTIARPPALTDDTLAVVRDETSWSRLIPAAAAGADEGVELFGVFSFHFPHGLDNSGFVGWLATHLKTALGTGVFVVCGSNQTQGGIYDYWGCPIDLVEDAFEVVRALRAN